jgi:hypothetical protein
MDWTADIENTAENIRVNSILFSSLHKKRYLYLKHLLLYFRLPVIIISGANSVISVGLQNYCEQQLISAITCLLALVCGLIGSVELFLGIQSQMEDELVCSKDFYLLAIDIYKILSLTPNNRNVDGKSYLDEKYQTYIKLVENSNLLTKTITDYLTPLPLQSVKTPSIASSSQSTMNDII